MTDVVASPKRRWRDKPLKRLAVELSLIVVAKLALLMLIWYVAIRPLPRADVSPAGVDRMLAPASASTQGTSP
ncbi:cytochrome oxidase putative small subunit CydP [Luteibacter sp. CQ10]|uniref:cytochrome oxidase putative small subunit CydP n=1 Tax=Luteibacter sp. CQ10 TaxID=2805821 RepID=UPI0034A2480B